MEGKDSVYITVCNVYHAGTSEIRRPMHPLAAEGYGIHIQRGVDAFDSVNVYNRF